MDSARSVSFSADTHLDAVGTLRNALGESDNSGQDRTPEFENAADILLGQLRLKDIICLGAIGD
jgi:hypothetical protein